ncbi:MAG: hypothetical protein M3346_10700 [Actinomycetota bacterium]|nr:hypothetical protein [Actinomycetota bacterium]
MQTPPELTGPEASSAHVSGLRRSALVAFAASVLIGGSNFVAVKFSNQELDPT